MKRSWLRGHPMIYKNGRWVYEDNGEPTEANYKNRPCGHCQQMQTPEDHDYCLKNLPGVDNACCGHGIKELSYIQFTSGIIITNFEIGKNENKKD